MDINGTHTLYLVQSSVSLSMYWDISLFLASVILCFQSCALFIRLTCLGQDFEYWLKDCLWMDPAVGRDSKKCAQRRLERQSQVCWCQLHVRGTCVTEWEGPFFSPIGRPHGDFPLEQLHNKSLRNTFNQVNSTVTDHQPIPLNVALFHLYFISHLYILVI